ELAKESKALIPLLEAMKKDFKAFDADGNGVITLGDIPKFSNNNLPAIKTKILSLKDDELEQMKKAIGAEGAPIQTLVSSGLGDDRIKEELAKKANELFKDYLGMQK
ncbi:MAG: hypothetical protein K2X66_14730, partial [Cyanobacteria bacterium]|nr:hypothetical protein [Cyanobacteriota bacterium]